MEKIGFVGIGKMGMPIACNLLKNGCEVTAGDLNREALRFFTRKGGRSAGSLGELAAHCDTLFFCLPGFAETEAVMQGPDGVLAQATAGTCVIDLGSGDPYKTALIAEKAEEKGLFFLDAPVDGGTDEAAAGTLTIMVGGSRAAFDKTKRLLDRIGRQIFYMGASGAGHKTKLIHSIITRAHWVILCEAMVLGVKAGLAPEQILTVMNAGAAESQVSRRYGSQMVRNDNGHEPAFAMDRRCMENLLAMETRSRTALPLAGLVSQLLVVAKNMGGSAADVSVVLKPYEALARIGVGTARESSSPGGGGTPP